MKANFAEYMLSHENISSFPEVNAHHTWLSQRGCLDGIFIPTDHMHTISSLFDLHKPVIIQASDTIKGNKYYYKVSTDSVDEFDTNEKFFLSELHPDLENTYFTVMGYLTKNGKPTSWELDVYHDNTFNF